MSTHWKRWQMTTPGGPACVMVSLGYSMEVSMNAAVSRLVVSQSGSRTKPLAGRLLSMIEWIGDYIETTANCYAAASMYEQLSRLSDAELQRRGLSREGLGRDVIAAMSGAKRAG